MLLRITDDDLRVSPLRTTTRLANTEFVVAALLLADIVVDRAGVILVTKADLAITKAELKEEIAEVRGEIAEVRGEIVSVEIRLTAKIADIGTELKTGIATMRAEMANQRADLTRLMVVSLSLNAVSMVGLMIAVAKLVAQK